MKLQMDLLDIQPMIPSAVTPWAALTVVLAVSSFFVEDSFESALHAWAMTFSYLFTNPYEQAFDGRILSSIHMGLADYISIRLYAFLKLYTIRISTLPRYLHKSSAPGSGDGSWALVTGGSDGIGKAFVKELASRGFNVVIHGRNLAKLDALRKSLSETHPEVHFRVVVADAAPSHGMKAAIEEIVQSLSDLPGPLTVLINNVGGAAVLDPPYKLLSDSSSADVDAIININARFTSQLTRALMSTLMQSKSACILNLVSACGNVTVTPWLATYSGSKAYIQAWSTALGRELKASKVDIEVLSLNVGKTTDASGFTEARSLTQPDARDVARSALDRVGCGRWMVTAHWFHAVQLSVLALFPDWAIDRILEKVIGALKDEAAKKV